MTKIRLTAAAHEPHRDDAIALAVAWGWIEGWRPEEWQGTFTAQRQDGAGNLYRVFSAVVDSGFLATASKPVERPAEDTPDENGNYVVNMAGARRAQGIATMWVAGQDSGDPPVAGPDKITAIVGMKGTDALAAMGLKPIPMEV